jgi:hypothetical protein
MKNPMKLVERRKWIDGDFGRVGIEGLEKPMKLEMLVGITCKVVRVLGNCPLPALGRLFGNFLQLLPNQSSRAIFTHGTRVKIC